MSMRGLVPLVRVIVVLGGLAASHAARASITRLSASGPGCDPLRPAVAHHAGAAAALPVPLDPPIPCATLTGATTESAAVGVAASGAVFYAPLFQTAAPPGPATLGLPVLAARSLDQGASWESRDPTMPAGFSIVPWMHVDPTTSRLWLATPTATFCGAQIAWSDDEGEQWHINPSVGCPGQGALKIFEGPAPAGAAQPVGYPHVVYYCANLEDGSLQSILFCYKSLDGGTTFVPVGGFPDPIPPPPACGTTLREARPGIVGADGILYFPMNRCDSLGIAVSRDEGETWEILPVATTEIQDLYIASIAVDTAGNLYIAWMGAGRLPHLTISRDRGQSWSVPIMIAAPGVQQVRRIAITARGPGHVALAYLGSTDGGAHFNGYITESRNALDPQPLFWSASVNDPAEALVNGADAETFGDRLFFSTAAIAPDGTVWAGFHCAKTGACPTARVGVAGRLAWPAVDCLPLVVGPIPITAESQPYRGLLVGPPRPGYVEEEFFISCAALGQTYQTLLHVRRPANPQEFSGTVVMEPTHPLGLWPITATTASYQADAGHVSVAAVSSRLVLELLVKGFNPDRYGALAIPETPGIEAEILAQIGALLKSDVGPLRERRAENVILSGFSNTGAVVREFITTKHDQARLADGAPVYDGYFPVQTAVGSAPTALPDLDVPVVEIQGESELIRTFQRGSDHLGYRRPDSASYRLYEVAGMSHVTSRPGDGFLPNPYVCVEPLRSTFPNRYVWNNSLRNLIEWIDEGIAPPSAPRIELAADGRTVVRDERGNAVGGVRTSYLDVPVATYGAVSTNAPGAPPSSRCDFFSYEIPFTRGEFDQLYRSPLTYVRAVRARLRQLIRGRWYLKRDAKEALLEAVTRYGSPRRIAATLSTARPR